MRLSIIVAVAENGVIGRDDGLPWRLSADLKRFKQTTMGHHLIMGHKTFDSIGRPLPGRTSIILSRDRKLTVDGCLVANNLDDAIQFVGDDDDEAFIIGGRQVYELSLDRADRLYWTQVHASPSGDTLFPDMNWDGWRLVSEEEFAANEKNEFRTTYRIYDRNK
jgi:dihydrofolate reductase